MTTSSARLITTEVEGRRLTDVEARTQLVFLFISGNETTRHLIANVLWSLANDPDLLPRCAPTGNLSQPPSKSPCATTHLSGSSCETAPSTPSYMVSNSVLTTRLHSEWRPRTETNHISMILAVFGSIAPISTRASGLRGRSPRMPRGQPGALEARVAVEVFIDNVASVTPSPARPVRPGRCDLGSRASNPRCGVGSPRCRCDLKTRSTYAVSMTNAGRAPSRLSTLDSNPLYVL